MNVGSVDQTSDNLNGDTVGPIPREIQELLQDMERDYHQKMMFQRRD